MKHATWRHFHKIETQLDQLLVLVAALVDEGSDRAAAKALAQDVLAKTATLKAAITPGSTGNQTP